MSRLPLLLLLPIAVSLHAKTGSELISENGFAPEVAPILHTQWSQDGGENSHTPLINGKHAPTGCGATATAQVMRHWEYPDQSWLPNYYIWDDPSTGDRNVLWSDFDNEYIWFCMEDRYKGTDETLGLDQVARLMADLGILLEMKYDPDGTATNIEYISTVLKKFYGYNPAMTIHRYANGAYSMDEWLTMIYRELSEGRPIIMGGRYGIYNHIYVADGYDAEGKVHLNLGKASYGSSCNIDGYYDLSVTGQTYNTDMRMLIGISPEADSAEPDYFHVATPGTLKETLGGDLGSRKLCRVRISGTLNTTDIAWLRTLSDYTTGQLSYIDLSDALIEGDALPANAFDNCYTLQEIRLPRNLSSIKSQAFRNCTGLWKITLPDNLSSIGDYAFSNCRYLEELILPSTLTTVGNNPFRYNKFDRFGIDESNPRFTVSNGALLDKECTTLYSMPQFTTWAFEIPDGVETVRRMAFVKQCRVPSLYIPASVREIASNAFLECISLRDIYVYRTDPPAISSDSFDATILSRCTLHVPAGSTQAYASSPWSAFTNIADDILLTGLDTPTADTSSDAPVAIYDLTGRRLTDLPSSGICIILHPDGTARKIVRPS